MAKPGAFGYYKELPGWAKGFIVIAFMAVAALVVYAAYKGIKKLVDIQKAKGAIDNASTQRKALEQSGVKPTYSDAQYATWANALQAAMNSTWGTDEQAIEDIMMKMRNDVDLFKLIEAYGVRVVKTPLWGADTTGDLGQCLAMELTAAEIKDLNENLRSNGIQHQF